MKHVVIRIQTELPDYSRLPDKMYDWEHSVYSGAEEVIPLDIPNPLGNPVILTTYVDANLYHDMITGRSVTSVLHFINKTPLDWYSKKQGTVETATYGSELVAGRTAMEQIMDIRTMLRYLRVPIIGHSYLFGDNKAVINSSSQPESR